MGITRVLSKMILGRAFSIQNGRITLLGKIQYLLYPSRALAGTFQKVGDDFGEDFLFELGCIAAKDANEEQLKVMSVDANGKKAQDAISAFLEFTGWGMLDLKDIKTENEKITGSFIMRKNPVVEASATLYGKDSKVCNFYRGVYTTHGTMIFGAKAKFTETKCVTKGDSCCEFVSKW